MITLKNYTTQISQYNPDTFPKNLKDGHDFLLENADIYDADEDIEKYIDMYLDKLNEWIEKNATKKLPEKSEKATTKKAEKKEVKTTTHEKPVKTTKVKTQQSHTVERVEDEIKFIKRYTLLHDKEKTHEQILSFLNSLQKAIIEKRIRKTSKYAKEIEHIQEQLIKCYNNMGDTIRIKIDEQTLASYMNIAGSETTMLSITLIKQYISLHGKTNVKEKANRLLLKLKKALDDENILEHDPNAEKLRVIYDSLNNYISNKTKIPQIQHEELKGLMGLAGCEIKKKITEAQNEKIKTSCSQCAKGVISSVELAGMDFETIGLQGKYRTLIGDPSVGFSCMVYGLPKSGKSTLCIDLASYFAKHHGKVLYVAVEEGYGYTLKEKIERLNATHPNLFISETIPNNLSDYDFVFIDSVSKGKIDNDMINKLILENPKTSFIFIFHSTKDGSFRGGQANAHDVDVIIEVADGVANGKGRFGIGGRIEVFV